MIIQLGKSNGSHELSLIFHGMEGGHYLSTFIALKWHRCPRLNVLFPVQGLFVTLEHLVGRDLSASPTRSTQGCSWASIWQLSREELVLLKSCPRPDFTNKVLLKTASLLIKPFSGHSCCRAANWALIPEAIDPEAKAYYYHLALDRISSNSCC